MDWTTVKSRTKRNRSESNDGVNTCPDTSVSPNKKQKSGNNATNLAKETKKHTYYKTDKPKSGPKSGNPENGSLNKDSILVRISKIPITPTLIL